MFYWMNVYCQFVDGWMDAMWKKMKMTMKRKEEKTAQNGPLNKWQILFLLTTTICCCCWRFWPQQQQQKCGQIINWEIIFRQTKKSDTFNNESFIIHVFFLFAFFFVVLTDNFRPIKSIYIWIIHMHFFCVCFCIHFFFRITKTISIHSIRPFIFLPNLWAIAKERNKIEKIPLRSGYFWTEKEVSSKPLLDSNKGKQKPKTDYPNFFGRFLHYYFTKKSKKL